MRSAVVLPRARRAEQDEELAVLDFEVEALDDLDRAEGLVDVLEPDPHRRYPLTAPTSRPRAMCF